MNFSGEIFQCNFGVYKNHGMITTHHRSLLPVLAISNIIQMQSMFLSSIPHTILFIGVCVFSFFGRPLQCVVEANIVIQSD